MLSKSVLKSQTNHKERNKKLIRNWHAARQQKDRVAKLLLDGGNKFSLVRSNDMTMSIHIYFGCTDSGLLSFHSIEAIDDASKDFEWISSTNLSNQKEEISKADNTSPNQLAWEQADLSVKRWLDDDKRYKWLSAGFNDVVNQNRIVQAISVDTKDFEIGIDHDCYLALREGESKEQDYTFDLIILNSANGLMLNPFEHESLGHLVKPVPPFDGSQYQYGMLNDLGLL